MPAPPPLADEIATFLAAYRPLLASDEHALLIRDFVGWYFPSTRREAEVVASVVSAFVYWAERSGLPIDPAYLCDPAVVEAYAAQTTSITERTKQSTRSVLHRIVRQRPGPHAYDRPAPRPRPGRSAPYTPQEVDALLLWAENQPKPARRHALLAILVLGLGAGLDSADIRLVHGSDIASDPATGAVLVHVRSNAPRHVPFLARYEQDALGLAAAAGDGWLVRPDLDPQQSGRHKQLISDHFNGAQPAADGTPMANVARCRNTWLVHHLERGVRLDVLADAGGYTEAYTIARLTGFMGNPPAPADLITMLRDVPESPDEDADVLS